MSYAIHRTGMSNVIGAQIVADAAAQTVPGATHLATVASALQIQLISIQPPKNMKVDIVGDNDDMDINVHPV